MGDLNGPEVRVIRNLVIPPELGESIEVRLLDWVKGEGDLVAAGDALLEFETDKAIVLVTAVQAGFLRKCLFAAGDWMKPGDIAALLSDRADEALPGDGTSAGDLMLVTFDVT
jgi:pyruvate/2-oxoglutarate dehydrogenase complex dihydrolipoamide acyltransferase (E2) component